MDFKRIKNDVKTFNWIDQVPRKVRTTLHRLIQNGYEAFLVGGACRDLFWGFIPKDWDIASNAPLTEIQKLFENVKVTGKSFEVARVKFPNMEIEIARYRQERDYEDFRHPSTVTFVDRIEEDLARRDFTINAVAMNEVEIVMCAESLIDLEDFQLQTMGNPKERFTEDPLRMLRMFRFCSQKGVRPEQTTLNMCSVLRNLIHTQTQERIRDEFFKLIMGTRPAYALDLMLGTGVLQEIIPEVVPCINLEQWDKYHIFPVMEHILNVVHYLSEESLEMKLAGFFHDLGKPLALTFDDKNHPHFYGNNLGLPTHEDASAEIAEKTLLRWKCSSELIKKVVILVRYHMIFNSKIGKKALRKLIGKIGFNTTRDLYRFHVADKKGSGIENDPRLKEEHFLSIPGMIDEIENSQDAVRVADLKIDGYDVMELVGLEGRAIGNCLKDILDLVINDVYPNMRKDLLKALEEEMKKPYLITKWQKKN